MKSITLLILAMPLWVVVGFFGYLMALNETKGGGPDTVLAVAGVVILFSAMRLVYWAGENRKLD